MPDEVFGMNLSRLCLISVCLWMSGCQEKTDANAIADRFVDAYYIEFNLEKALDFTTAMAQGRIEAEQKLVAESRKHGALSSARAKVYYDEPKHQLMSDERAAHDYVLENHSASPPIKTRVLIMTVKKDDQWKVISFREVDGRMRSNENPRLGSGMKAPEGVEVKSGTSTTSTSSETRP